MIVIIVLTLLASRPCSAQDPYYSDDSDEIQQAFFDAAEKALINNSLNLFKLKMLLSPSSKLSAQSVGIFFSDPCAFMIKNLSILQQPLLPVVKPGFVNCDYCCQECSCLNLDYNGTVNNFFTLSNNANSDYSSKLRNFICSSPVYSFLNHTEYLSVYFLNLLTNTKLQLCDDYFASKNLVIVIDTLSLDTMPEISVIEEVLEMLLSWVSFLFLTPHAV